MKKIYSFSEWVYRLFVLHVFWLLFSFAGLLIAGIFPATVALFATIRKIKLEPLENSLFHTFCQYYKVNFFKANVFGLLYIAIGLIIYIYLQFLSATTYSFLAVTHLVIYGFILFFLLFLSFLFPVYIHFNGAFKETLKQTFIIVVTNWKFNILMLIVLYIYFEIVIRYAVILVFFGLSIPAYFLFTISLFAFEDFKTKRETEKMNRLQ